MYTESCVFSFMLISVNSNHFIFIFSWHVKTSKSYWWGIFPKVKKYIYINQLLLNLWQCMRKWNYVIKITLVVLIWDISNLKCYQLTIVIILILNAATYMCKIIHLLYGIFDSLISVYYLVQKYIHNLNISIN